MTKKGKFENKAKCVKGLKYKNIEEIVIQINLIISSFIS